MFSTPLKKTIAGLVLLFIVSVLAVIIGWWWQTRPLPITSLTEPEIQQIDRQVQPLLEEIKNKEIPSSHTIQLTERELNGYISQHDKLAGKCYFTLNEGFISAEIVETLPATSPLLAGKKVNGSCEIHFKQGTKGLEMNIQNIRCFGFSAPESFTSSYIGKNLLPQLFKKLNLEDNYSQYGKITVDSEYLTLSLNQ